MYFDNYNNYAGHMLNFTGSVDCWGFLAGGGRGCGGRVKRFYHAKTMTREGKGV